MSHEESSWLQGCVVAGNTSLSSKITLLHESPFWMVVTHSCSIYNTSCECLELMPFSIEDYISDSHGLLRKGRNPRELFLVTEWEDSAKKKPRKGLRFNHTKRCWVNKADVIDNKPETLNGNLVVSAEHIKTVITWLGHSYTRAALPAAFERAAKPIISKLGDFLRGKHETLVARVYFDLEPATEELAAPDSYTFELILIPEGGVSGEQLRQLLPSELSAVAKLSTDILLYGGVNIMDLQEVTIAQAEQWVWWDHMDYISSQGA